MNIHCQAVARLSRHISVTAKETVLCDSIGLGIIVPVYCLSELCIKWAETTYHFTFLLVITEIIHKSQFLAQINYLKWHCTIVQLKTMVQCQS